MLLKFIYIINKKDRFENVEIIFMWYLQRKDYAAMQGVTLCFLFFNKLLIGQLP